MQTTPTAATAATSNRATGWLLAATPAAFAIWFAAAMTTLSGAGVTNSADLAPAQMSTIRTGWAVIWVVYALALLLGLAAMTRLDRRLGPGRWVTIAHVAHAVGAVLIVVYAAAMVTMSGFTEPRLGDHPWWDGSMVLSVGAVSAALVGVTLSGVALRRSGYLRRTGLGVAIAGGVLLALTAVTAGGIPPFAPALLWLVIGIALLRRPVTSPS